MTSLRYLWCAMLGAVAGIAAGLGICFLLTWGCTAGNTAGRGIASGFYFELVVVVGYLLAGLVIGVWAGATASRRGLLFGTLVGLGAAAVVALAGNRIEALRSRYPQYDTLQLYALASLGCMLAGAYLGWRKTPSTAGGL